MANREPLQYIEIDVDRCARTFGVGFCGASLQPAQTRTNFLTWSEAFDDVSWNKISATVTANAALSPRGDFTADRFVPNAGSGEKLLQKVLSSTNLSAQRTFSVFIAANGVTDVQLFMYNNAFTTGIVGLFNLATGTVASTTIGTPLSVITPRIESVGNGWYRCIIGGSLTNTTENWRVLIRRDGTDNGTSGFFVWGAQIENAADASAYIPTQSTSVSAPWGGAVRKCFNTYNTCPVKPVFDKVYGQLRYVNNRGNTPVGFIGYPALEEGGITAFSSSVNIAGSNPSMGAFGRRATVSVKLKDFVDDDVWFDKYQLERVSGAAQASGVGYSPKDLGTHFSKLKVRWPFYAGRPMRVVDAFIEDGVIVVDKTRHFIITDINGPNSDGSVTVEGKDILALADDKKALCPTPSRGKIGANMLATGNPVIALTPAGIGAEYPASGWATIGSEVVSFTRAGDNVTITGRGLYGTVAASHSTGDSFQTAKNIVDTRVDDLVYDLLVNFAKVNPSFVPLVTKWEPEITKWASFLKIDTVITKPTGVGQLLGELADLGFSIWWDEVLQEVGLLATHPVDSGDLYPISDRNNIKKIEQQDKDEDRITQVHFYSKQTNPTQDYKDKSNYSQINVLVDTDAESANAYNETTVKEVFCRWLNNGADAVVRVLSLRMLNRLNTPPRQYTILLDYSDDSLGLTDVIELDSRISTDETGNIVKPLLQVIRKTQKRSGHEVEILTQAFNYSGRYGQITENTRPVYGLSSATQKRLGAYFVSGLTLKFPDGGPPYAFI